MYMLPSFIKLRLEEIGVEKRKHGDELDTNAKKSKQEELDKWLTRGYLIHDYFSNPRGHLEFTATIEDFCKYGLFDSANRTGPIESNDNFTTFMTKCIGGSVEDNVRTPSEKLKHLLLESNNRVSSRLKHLDDAWTAQTADEKSYAVKAVFHRIKALFVEYNDQLRDLVDHPLDHSKEVFEPVEVLKIMTECNDIELIGYGRAGCAFKLVHPHPSVGTMVCKVSVKVPPIIRGYIDPASPEEPSWVCFEKQRKHPNFLYGSLEQHMMVYANTHLTNEGTELTARLDKEMITFRMHVPSVRLVNNTLLHQPCSILLMSHASGIPGPQGLDTSPIRTAIDDELWEKGIVHGDLGEPGNVRYKFKDGETPALDQLESVTVLDFGQALTTGMDRERAEKRVKKESSEQEARAKWNAMAEQF